MIIKNYNTDIFYDRWFKFINAHDEIKIIFTDSKDPDQKSYSKLYETMDYPKLLNEKYDFYLRLAKGGCSWCKKFLGEYNESESEDILLI